MHIVWGGTQGPCHAENISRRSNPRTLSDKYRGWVITVGALRPYLTRCISVCYNSLVLFCFSVALFDGLPSDNCVCHVYLSACIFLSSPSAPPPLARLFPAHQGLLNTNFLFQVVGSGSQYLRASPSVSFRPWSVFLEGAPTLASPNNGSLYS